MIGNFNDFIGLLKEWLEALGIENWLIQIIIGVVISAMFLIIAFFFLIKFWKWIDLRGKQKFLNKDLHPFYTPLEVDKATRYYIPTKYQDIAPSQSEEPNSETIDASRSPLIPMLLNKGFNKDGNRHYLILADSGMGKTTFMINLYLKYKKQYFFRKPEFDIKLFPLGHPKTNEAIKKIDNPANTILLLDAFDEDLAAVKNFQKRIKDIIDLTWEFREIVITSRTQFFPTQKDEPSSTGFTNQGPDGGELNFRKTYVSVFDDQDIKTYINNRYSRFNPLNWKKRKAAYDIVQKSPSLMMRPMLLSHIPDLVEENHTFDYTYQIYEVLIEKWIERESNKSGIIKKYGSREHFKKELLEFSQNLAVDIYLNRKKRNGLFVSKDEKIKTNTNLQLSDLEDNMELMSESDKRSRSLLNRDAEGRYKFSHKSILEYFLVKEIIQNKIKSKVNDLKGMEAGSLFIKEMIIRELWDYIEGDFCVQQNPSRYYPFIDIIIFKTFSNITQIRFLDGKSYSNLIYSNLFQLVPKLNKFFVAYSNDNILFSLYGLFMIGEKENNDLRSHALDNINYKYYKSDEVEFLLELLNVDFDAKKCITFFKKFKLNALVNHITLPENVIYEPFSKGKNIEKNTSKKIEFQFDLSVFGMFSKDRIKLRELLHGIKVESPNLIDELKKIEHFIIRMQNLEKQHPNIKFYY